MFNANSQLVKTWVRLVQGGQFTVDEIPNLFNLRDVVKSVLDAEKENEQLSTD